MRTARIPGTGYYLPKEEVTNEGLFERLNHEGYEWVQGFTKEKFLKWVPIACGVGSRHYANEKETTEEMAYHASMIALDDARISKEDVGMIIFNTLTPSRLVPQAAVSLRDKLGISKREVEAKTINQACAGFVEGMANAYRFVGGGYDRPILVVSADRLSRIKKLFETPNCILFGDGASACVIVPSEDKGFIGEPIFRTEYSEDIIIGSSYEEFIFKGKAVAEKASEGMADIARKALSTTQYNIGDVAYVIPHQANGVMIRDIAHKLGLPERRVINVIKRLGNISGATVGYAFDMLRKREIIVDGIPLELKDDDKVIFTAIGGGYAAASIVYQV